MPSPGGLAAGTTCMVAVWGVGGAGHVVLEAAQHQQPAEAASDYGRDFGSSPPFTGVLRKEEQGGAPAGSRRVWCSSSRIQRVVTVAHVGKSMCSSQPTGHTAVPCCGLLQVAQDYRMDPQLHDKCKDSMEQLCKNVEPGSGGELDCLVRGRRGFGVTVTRG